MTYPSPSETRISSRSVGSSSQMRIVREAIASHDQPEDEELVPRRAAECRSGERAAGVLVETRPADDRELVEEARGEHAGGHERPLRQEVGAAAVRRAGATRDARDVRMADRLRRDAAVEEELAVEVEVAGTSPVLTAIDVDVLDEPIGDPDRAGPGERRGAAGRRDDRESPARSRNRDQDPIDHLLPPSSAFYPTRPGAGAEPQSVAVDTSSSEGS